MQRPKSAGLWNSITKWTEAEITFHHEDKVLLVLTLVIGGIVGLVVVAFILVTENLSSKLYPVGGAAWRRLVLPVAGALITGFLLQRYFPNARGSGIPQTKTALFIRNGVILLRTALGKFGCSSVSLASGIALGREGPSVQVAAGIASSLGRRLGLSSQRVKALVPIASAAALAAAFNTPIAAVLFTLEEVMGDLHAPVLGSIVLSSATSWIVLRSLLGDEPLFHVPAYQLVHPIEFGFYAVLGAVGGLVSVAFVKLLLWERKYFLRMPAFTEWFQPAAGGLLVGVLGWFVPQVLGVGYGFVSQALNGQMVLTLMAVLVVLKLVATATCYASGNSGGIFGPSLFLGAMLGGAFGGTAHLLMPDYTASIGAYALVGMGAAFAGIIRVPLTSVIMIFEVTRDYSIIVPLMIANLISYFISSRLQETPIYEALLEQDHIHLPPAAREREELLTVGQACHPPAETITAGEALGHAVTRLKRDETAWPVVDGRAFLGMVTRDMLEKAIRAGNYNDPVGVLLAAAPTDSSMAFPHVYSDDPLDTALRRMAQHGLKVLPVVNRTDMQELMAVVSLRGILTAYGVEGNRQVVHEDASGEKRISVKLLVGTAAVLVFAVALAAFLSNFYRTARIARAERYFNAGNSLMAQGHSDEAIEQFRSAVSISHTSVHRLALAEALLKAGHPDEAQIYFGELLRENPDSGPANLGVGRIKAQEGAVQDAVRAYQRAIYGFWPSDPDGQRLKARLELIDVLEKARDTDQAKAELLSLKAEMPPDPALRRHIGHLFLTFGMPAESIAIFRDLLKSNHNDAETYAELGEAEFAMNDLPAAQAAYRNAARHKPDNAAYQERVNFLDRVINLDPAIRGSSPADRYRRSRNLLAAVLETFDQCHGLSPAAATDSARETADKARRLLRQSAKPRSLIEAANASVDLAILLWNERAKLCGAASPAEQALSHAMADVIR